MTRLKPLAEQSRIFLEEVKYPELFVFDDTTAEDQLKGWKDSFRVWLDAAVRNEKSYVRFSIDITGPGEALSDAFQRWLQDEGFELKTAMSKIRPLYQLVLARF